MNEALVDEILKRVLKAMKDNQKPLQEDKKEKILILASKHQEGRQEILENQQILKHYIMDYRLPLDYSFDLNEYQAVVLYDLSNTILGKLCQGIYDSPLLELLAEIILSGKQIYVPTQEVELYQYKNSAPQAYYKMMLDKISFLQESGIIFIDKTKLAEVFVKKQILKIKDPEGVKETKPIITNNKCDASEKSVILDKKVITKKDLEQAYESGASSICISKRSILSDIAKEYAKNRNIELQRNELCLEYVEKSL